jgi:uncharacterized membrane protein
VGGFRRSGTFGIVGVFVVAGVVAAIATTMGSEQARPKLALGLGRSLGAMPASKRWSGVKVEGGPDGLIVYRRSNREGD